MKHSFRISLFLIAATTLLFACEALAVPAPETVLDTVPEGETAVVTWVVDGDTVEVEFPDGRTERVRYIGINTPEWDERCGDEATKKNIALVKNETVTLVSGHTDRDRYDRLLRYIFVGNTLINAELIETGYAFARVYEPDQLYEDLFYDLEDAAERDNVGCLWE